MAAVRDEERRTGRKKTTSSSQRGTHQGFQRPPAGRKDSRWGFRGMTLRDWSTTLRDWLPIIGAVLVPVMVAAGTWEITRQQGEIADQRAQDEALQAYLDVMERLLFERSLLGPDSQNAGRADNFARAHTLVILPRLDGERKGSVVQFLYEGGFIGFYHDRSYIKPVFVLHDSDLREAVLDEINLYGANLSGSTLSGADLSGAYLRKASLFGADLREADLSGANLGSADLREADLSKADLGAAKEWTVDQLTAAESLEGATMPNGQKYEDWLNDQ